jgi:hypothetical protein
MFKEIGGQESAEDYHEKLVKFHDQKNDLNFDQKTGIVYKKSYNIASNINEKDEKEYIGNIKKVIEDIDSVYLMDEAANDDSQIKLLIEKKKIAKSVIFNVLSKVKEYIQIIQRMESIKIDNDNYDPKKYWELNELRTRAHNALIDEIRIAIRFISRTFGEIDERAIEKYEEELEKKGLMSLEANRIKFTPNIIIPQNIDLRDRKQIAYWAEQIYNELSELEMGLN